MLKQMFGPYQETMHVHMWVPSYAHMWVPIYAQIWVPIYVHM